LKSDESVESKGDEQPIIPNIRRICDDIPPPTLDETDETYDELKIDMQD
jgi:hypothetical protein